MSETAREDPGSPTGRYGVYGITVETDFPFRTPLPAAEAAVDLTFTRVWSPPAVGPWEDEEPIFESQYLTDGGEPQVRFYRHRDVDVFRQTGVADYYVWPNRVVCHQHDATADDVVELYFLSLLMGFWLESRGVLVLHASAVSVGGKAVAFLATNTGGKTSLSTSLMRAGHPLLTDDFLAVSLAGEEAVAQPGFPQMRMWPDLADHFLGDHDHLPLVLPDVDKRRVPVEMTGLGEFCRTGRPLSGLYLPVRMDDASVSARVEMLPPQQALIELVRESFLGTILEKTGLHRERFSRLATLVRRVPVARLIYPSGLDRLPEARDAVLADVGRAG